MEPTAPSDELPAADSALLARVLAGETAAFDELAGRYRDSLRRFIVSVIGDADEAESLTQETLTRAFAALATYRADLAFRAWLFGIARNLCRNHFRDMRRHAKVTAPERLGEVAANEGRRQGVLSGVLRREVHEHLARAVGLLPEAFRQAFELHFVEGLDYAEISRRTGVAAGTLRVRAHRARALLRDELGPVVDTWLAAGPRG
ncbi:MAG TPA: sigma-70 family RNA polymerase sigma factor [Pirellulales bacterium]|jgi:RNA polymerase sigma-70 factor (ECF subfamily)|nr:sigma-70 family RNA polymerase sigma factor [Pirellulales bacterium]